MDHCKQLFKTNNYADLGVIDSGRCFSLCCEWTRACILDYNVISINQLDNERINQGQIYYECNIRNDKKLLEEYYKVHCTLNETFNYSFKFGNSIIKDIARSFFSAPLHVPIIIGLCVYEKHSGYAHAMAGRKILLNNQLIYEFLDPSYGIWQSINEENLIDKIYKLLKYDYSEFIPTHKTSLKKQYILSKLITSLPKENIIHKYNEKINNMLDNCTNNISQNESYLYNLSSKYQKKILLCIKSILTKDQQIHIKLPLSNNKMAKMKYKEFLNIFNSFIEIASEEQLSILQKNDKMNWVVT